MKSVVMKALSCLGNEQKRVLDIGSGVGNLSLSLARNGYIVTALDKEISKVMNLSNFAHINNINIRCVTNDIRDFQFRKQDLIVSLNTLNSLSKNEIHDVITKIKENTNINGVNVITVIVNKNSCYSYSYLFSKNELKDMYRDWEIKYYDEGEYDLEQHNNLSPHTHIIAEIVAKKRNNNTTKRRKK